MNSHPATHNGSVTDAAEQVLQNSQRDLEDAAQPPASGSEMLRWQAEQLQARAVQARDLTVGYIQHEPLKAVLMAAVGAAALMWLVGLLGRRGPR